MKRGFSILSIILVLVFTINLISAVEIKLTKDNYQPIETLQAEITGNFIDSLLLSNILIYKEGIPRSTPVISDLTKQGNIYYFYAILPNQEGNFSLKIENTRHTESGTEKKDAIVKNFTIAITNESALQINPGFVKTSTDFSIKVKALKENQDVSLSFNGDNQNIFIIEDSEKTISFEVKNLSGKKDLKISKYTIPVFIVSTVLINSTIINNTNQTNINKTANETKINITNKTEAEIKAMHCADFGVKCADNTECDGETKSSLEGSCCVGKCTEKKERSYTWIGILIILIILIAMVFIYLKGRRRPPSSEEILKSKSKDFENRMENKEVSGRLGNI